ncbi:MAG: peptidylprolyl isomerase [Aquificae bacterium]|nr:peptidylprolyl isomerase [Aquificota bacterium]
MVPGGLRALRGKVLLGALVALLAFGAQLIDRVVASVNGEPILESDLRLAQLYYGINDRRELLQKLIEVNLVYQYLRARGVDVPDDKIDALVLELAHMNGMTLEELRKEFEKSGLTLKDFKRFLKKDLMASRVIWDFLARELSVSELELELARLKEGPVKLKKQLELLVLPKEAGEELLKELERNPEPDLKELAGKLDGEYELLTVEKGDLLPELDAQVWRAREGELVFAEDGEHLYVARVLKTVKETVEGDEEELKRALFEKKLKEKYQELLNELSKKSVIVIVEEAPGAS